MEQSNLNPELEKRTRKSRPLG